MEEKKKSSIVTIILVIILMIGCVIGGYFINEKDLLNLHSNKKEQEEKNEKDNKKQDEVEEEKAVTFTDTELEKYVNYIVPSSIEPSKLLFNTSSVDVLKLSNTEKINYIGSYLMSKVITSSDYQYDIITEADVKSAVEEIYGPNTYQKATFNLGCGDYVLNEAEGKYYSKTGCGGTTATVSSNVIIDYKATTKKLEITTAYAFYDAMTSRVYKDFDKTIELDSYSSDSLDQSNSYLDNYVKSNKDKLNHIVYTFESSDGVHYYFKGFTNNK